VAEKVTILILGVGPTGASIGLALQRAGMSFDRVGYDPHGPTAQQALKIGAVDRTVSQPARAGEVDLVLLTLPPARALEAVEALAGRLRPETVVLCGIPLSSQDFEAVCSRLGSANPCLLAVPFLGPQKALTPEGDSAAAADVYDGGLLAIVSPVGTSQGALEISLDLATILGATPFFLEPAELDSVTATSEHLPALLSAATLASLSANPGWRDQRRLVGNAFARLAGLLEGTPADLAAAWIATRDPLMARLDALTDELASLRQMLAAADEDGLAERLESASAHDREWRGARASARPDVPVAVPGVPRLSLFDRLLGGGLSSKKS